MTRDEAIALAKKTADSEGWFWKEPIFAKRERPFIFFGQLMWVVMSNSQNRGGNVFVRINDKTGEILSKGFAPR
jgi:hypothetical protein